MSTWCRAHAHWTTWRVTGGVCERGVDPRPPGVGHPGARGGRPPMPPQPVYCVCPLYVPEPIPLFATSQCAACGRPQRP